MGAGFCPPPFFFLSAVLCETKLPAVPREEFRPAQGGNDPKKEASV